MNDTELLKIITSKSSEHTIRDIVKNISIKSDDGDGFKCGNIYYFIFKDIDSLYNRVCNQINPKTKILDGPISMYISKTNECIFEGWGTSEASKCNIEIQICIFICIYDKNNYEDKYSFAPVLCGIFDLLAI